MQVAATHTTDQNRETAERVFLDLLDRHDLDLIPDLYAADCAFYGMGTTEGIDREGYEAFLEAYFAAFPDLSFAVDEILVDDDRAAVRWHSSGTHEGELNGVPATGRSVVVPGMSFLHFEDGKIREAHATFDSLDLLRQLDAAPE